jgi:tetratricopeptide (TPR) repeat protein
LRSVGALLRASILWPPHGRPASQEEIGREIYSPRLKGTLGFDLWRYARRQGLAAVEIRGGDEWLLDALLSQDVPVILNLGAGIGKASLQHYVLLVSHDPARRVWRVQDGKRPNRKLSEKRLARLWKRTGRWGLVAFPPDRFISGLGADFNIQLAERIHELNHPENALLYLEQALAEKAEDARLWVRVGDLRAGLSRLSSAERAYRRAMELQPANPDAYNNLAMFLARHPARQNEAEALARRALSLCVTDARLLSRMPYVLDTLGAVLQRRKKETEARAVLSAALSSVPADSPLAAEIRGRLSPKP